MWGRETRFVKIQSILLDLFSRERQRWIEMTTKPLHIFTRNLSYSEKSQDVIYTETIEIIT